MSNRRIMMFSGIVIALCVGTYFFLQSDPTEPITGIVRETEVRLASEVGGQLTSIKVQNGTKVHVGEVVAELSAVELLAAVAQARALLQATIAHRNDVYAGVRAEKIAALAAEIDKAKSRLTYVEAQRVRASKLARKDFASKQVLDNATYDAAEARADVAEAEANYAAAIAGPTKQERAIADAEVQAASAAVVVLERRLDKTVLRSPVNGAVSVIVAEIGENIRVGEPVLTIAVTGKSWLSFNAREDLLDGLAVGATAQVKHPGVKETIPATVTELRPLGTFATWQAERAVGDYDRNTLRLRLDPQNDSGRLEPGMTVWVSNGS